MTPFEVCKREIVKMMSKEKKLIRELKEIQKLKMEVLLILAKETNNENV